MVTFCYEFHDKFMLILMLDPIDGVWACVNNVSSDSLVNMLQEYVLLVSGPNRF